MKGNRELPMWAVISSVAVVVCFVVALFAKGMNGGDASKDELMLIRNNQRSFAGTAATATTAAQGRSPEPLGGTAAPPGAIMSPSR